MTDWDNDKLDAEHLDAYKGGYEHVQDELDALRVEFVELRTRFFMSAGQNAKLIMEMGRVGLENDALRAKVAELEQASSILRSACTINEESIKNLLREYDALLLQIDAQQAQIAALRAFRDSVPLEAIEMGGEALKVHNLKYAQVLWDFVDTATRTQEPPPITQECHQ